MRFATLSIFVCGIAAVTASPIIKERNGSASVKNVQCCQQMMTQGEASQAFGSLLALDGLIGNVGLNCSPLGLSVGSKCKSTPVLCSDVYQDGLINLGCSPLSVL
ncbi:MAG: hypothetical protein CYPHOPRED_004624 [Cyphobasidiales sp. Tagirdzhanova-0007]|nr:MAG: hypothetical protein CYPHOPRED_004624 [Cyphobasidiales sp. Tagirdzhanova-0007]